MIPNLQFSENGVWRGDNNGKKWPAKTQKVFTIKEHRYRELLCSLGFNNQEIASLCGVTEGPIRRWRKRNGYKRAVRYCTNPWYYKKRLECYWRGYVDREIAEMFGCLPSKIARWRYRNGLSVNRDRRNSLCWECRRAVAMDCPWIDARQKIWEKARVDDNQTITVLECKHFVIEIKKEDVMWKKLEDARREYKAAEMQLSDVSPKYLDKAVSKLNAAREKLNSAIWELKVEAKAGRKGSA